MFWFVDLCYFFYCTICCYFESYKVSQPYCTDCGCYAGITSLPAEEDELLRQVLQTNYPRRQIAPKNEFLPEDQTRQRSVAFENVRWGLHTCPQRMPRQRLWNSWQARYVVRSHVKYGKSCSAHTILCINCAASVSVSLFLAFPSTFQKDQCC